MVNLTHNKCSLKLDRGRACLASQLGKNPNKFYLLPAAEAQEKQMPMHCWWARQVLQPLKGSPHLRWSSEPNRQGWCKARHPGPEGREQASPDAGRGLT